ncbi:MAG: class D sortase [Ruminococcus sp.]|nr:class D sortase [Ruminococcus sp.]
MSKKKGKNYAFLHIATPFVLLLLCAAVIIFVSVKPADKLKVYVNLAFMDGLKTDMDDTGLVIRDNEIIEEYTGETSDTGEVIRPQFGELFGMISSDKLSTDVPVYWGSTSELLEHGACQFFGSAIPGTSGNAVVSAHVDTYFADLEKLSEGDIVSFKTNYGEFTYTVSEQISFRSSENKYVKPTEDDRLTLYTCKRDILGASDERIGVICTLTESRFYTTAGEGEE